MDSERPHDAQEAEDALRGGLETLGPYRIARWVAQGGQGRVYEAVDTRNDQRSGAFPLPSQPGHVTE